jgi:hypothetical protein
VKFFIHFWFEAMHMVFGSEIDHLGTKIDQSGDNTTGIKHRISQKRKAINALNSI